MMKHLRVLLLVALVRSLVALARAGAPSQQPGKRRLETRGEIRRLAVPSQSRLAKLIDTRVRSALQGRVLLAEQPTDYRTGLSAADEQLLVSCVGRHFSFAPLDQKAETALAIEMDQIGATLEEGLGVRNQLYRDRHASFRGGLPREILPASWEQLPEACADRLAHAPAAYAQSGRQPAPPAGPASRPHQPNPMGGCGAVESPGRGRRRSCRFQHPGATPGGAAQHTGGPEQAVAQALR